MRQTYRVAAATAFVALGWGLGQAIPARAAGEGLLNRLFALSTHFEDRQGASLFRGSLIRLAPADVDGLEKVVCYGESPSWRQEGAE